MITSTKILANAVEKYQKNKEKQSDVENSVSSGALCAFNAAMLVFAVIFFVMEIILVFYAIYIAFRCTEGGPERIVHVTLAVFFTIPYMLLMTLFNKCAGETLRNGSDWAVSPPLDVSSE